MLDPLHPVLNSPVVFHIRRNHALEHASIHVLSARFPNSAFVGRSDNLGFFIYGNVSTAAISQAVHSALSRLRAGEHRLAIHPNCGTSFLTAAALSAGASFLALAGGSTPRRFRDRIERLPLAILASVAALFVAQPLGRTLQRKVTTAANVGGLQITEIKRLPARRVTIHRILTSDSA